MKETISGVFEDPMDLEQAIMELRSLGIPPEDISVVAREPETPAMAGRKGGYVGTSTEEERATASATAAGALTGGVLGGLAGLLAGMGAIAIPGIGPILAAGPIAATLGGAAVGAATGGLVGALIDAGLSEEQAQTYSQHVGHGDTFVCVRADEKLAPRVREIFLDFHAHEMSTFVERCP